MVAGGEASKLLDSIRVGTPEAIDRCSTEPHDDCSQQRSQEALEVSPELGVSLLSCRANIMLETSAATFQTRS